MVYSFPGIHVPKPVGPEPRPENCFLVTEEAVPDAVWGQSGLSMTVQLDCPEEHLQTVLIFGGHFGHKIDGQKSQTLKTLSQTPKGRSWKNWTRSELRI